MLCVVMAGCCTSQPNKPAAPAPAPAPAAVKPAAPAPAQTYNHVIRNYVCSECGDLEIEKIMPEKVNLNQPFDYKIIARNKSGVGLTDIKIMDVLGDNLIYKSSNPAAKVDGSNLSWMIDSMDAGATKEFIVSVAANKSGYVKSCANATYEIPACAKVQVVEPALTLEKTAPAGVLICDQIPLTYKVCNTGSGKIGRAHV